MPSPDDERRRREVALARKEQREASDRGLRSDDEGRWFHYGIAELRGEVARNGWQHEARMKLPSGRIRIHDAGRSINNHQFREYKEAERVGGEFVMEQISKEDELFRTDPKAEGAWIVREGAPDKEARKELERMQREFAGRFRLIEVSKKEAELAMKVGRDLERNPNQLELVDSQDLRKRERFKEQREKILEKQQVREAAQRAIAKEERERQIREAQQKQREAAQRVAESARQDREAAARGEKVPMTGREAADILAVSRPTPGVKSSHRTPPHVERSHGGRARPGRVRGQERER